MLEDDIEQLRKQLNRLYRRVRSEQPDVEGIPPTALEILLAVARATGTIRPGQLGAEVKRAGSIRPGQLGEELHMTSPNVASTLRTLEAMGLVTRRQDLNDGRKSYVELTLEGKKVVTDFRDNKPVWLREAITNTLTEREKNTLLKAGPLMKRLADYGVGRRSY